MRSPRLLALAACAAAIALPAYVEAQEKVLNLYTARHYQTDEALYDNFTKATGIKVNLTDYRIRAVTKGKDAMGEVQIELEHSGKKIRGRGVSTS